MADPENTVQTPFPSKSHWPLSYKECGKLTDKTIIQKDTCTSVFTAALFTIAKTWKQPKCPSMDEWIRKCGTYIYKEILPSHKKEWNNAIDSNTDGPRDYHMKWSKSQRERQVPYITYLWNLKYNTNEPIYKTETDSQTENRLAIAKGEGAGEKMEWEVGASHMKTITYRMNKQQYFTV